MKKHIFPFMILVFLLSISRESLAQISKLPYDGALPENYTLPNGTAPTLTFRIEPLEWQENHQNINVTDGRYRVILGSVTPFDPTKVSDIAEAAGGLYNARVKLEVLQDGSKISEEFISLIPPPKVQIPQIEEVPDEQEIEEEIEVELDIDISEDSDVEDIVFEETEDDIFSIVEDQPEFPGGMKACYAFIKNNLQYPEAAKKAGIEGRVYVEFVVDEAGEISRAKVVKGIGGGCDEEALRVFGLMPAFIPGKQRGEPVKVKMVLPVNFSTD